MANVREMREFESFVLRTHGLKLQWIGATQIVLTKGGRVEMECDVHKGRGRTRLVIRGDDGVGGRLRRFLQLMRFHITASDPKKTARALDAFSNREGDCKRNRCFHYMQSAFPTEWAAFAGGAPPISCAAAPAAPAAPAARLPGGPIIVNANTSSDANGDASRVRSNVSSR